MLGAPDDAIGRAIDAITGARGWSHVAVDVGLPPSSDPLLLDIDRHLGVLLHRRSAVFGPGRPTLRIEIEPRWHTFVRRKLARRIGEPYSILAMALQPLQIDAIGGAYCSRVVRECLPPHLAAKLPKLPAPSDFLVLLDGARPLSVVAS